MVKQVIYRYLGTNGVIESPVHLEDIYYTRSLALYADPGKKLTNGKVYKDMVRIPEEDLELWTEVSQAK